MELELAMEVWDNLSELNGMCLKQKGAKRTSQMSYGTQVATPALFCQRRVIFGYGRLWGSSPRVYYSKGCVKDVWNVCVSSHWLVSKFLGFWQVSCFWSKNVKLWLQACTNHQICCIQSSWSLHFVDLIWLLGSWPYAQRSWFDIKHTFAKMGICLFLLKA